MLVLLVTCCRFENYELEGKEVVMLLRSALGKFFFFSFNGSCFSSHKSYVKTLNVACVITSFVKGYENFSVFRMKYG